MHVGIRLTAKHETSIPVEVDGILPTRLDSLSVSQIERLSIWHGNRQIPLAEAFTVQRTDSDSAICWDGDLTGTHRIGEALSKGHVEVHGNAGRHVGGRMTGGRLEVHGDVSDFAGAEMKGGTLRVAGSAGNDCGAAYIGSPRGMNGGRLLVSGSVGRRPGSWMRRGLIAIGGSCGDYPGLEMLAGTMVVVGAIGKHPAGQMKRGTLCLFHATEAQLLPTFVRGCNERPLAMELVLRALQTARFPLPAAHEQRQFDAFHGDTLAGGRGEVFIARTDETDES